MNIRNLISIVALVVFPISGYGQVTAIKAGRLVDPETGTSQSKQILLIENGKIKAVGENIAIPTGAAVIDLSRSTVLPGLFDMHTHLCMDVIKERDNGDNYFFTSLLDPDHTVRSKA